MGLKATYPRWFPGGPPPFSQLYPRTRAMFSERDRARDRARWRQARRDRQAAIRRIRPLPDQLQSLKPYPTFGPPPGRHPPKVETDWTSWRRSFNRRWWEARRLPRMEIGLKKDGPMTYGRALQSVQRRAQLHRDAHNLGKARALGATGHPVTKANYSKGGVVSPTRVKKIRSSKSTGGARSGGKITKVGSRHSFRTGLGLGTSTGGGGLSIGGGGGFSGTGFGGGMPLGGGVYVK